MGVAQDNMANCQISHVIFWEPGPLIVRFRAKAKPPLHALFKTSGIYSPENERMSPENQWLEDVVPIEIVPFLGDNLGVFRDVETLVALVVPYLPGPKVSGVHFMLVLKLI